MPPVTGSRRDSRRKITRDRRIPARSRTAPAARRLAARRSRTRSSPPTTSNVHVAGDALELVAKQLKLVAARHALRRRGSSCRGRGGRRPGGSEFPLRPALRSRPCGRGPAARSRRPAPACGRGCRRRPAGKPTTSKCTRRGHGSSLSAIRSSQKPNASRDSSGEQRRSKPRARPPRRRPAAAGRD